MELGMMRDQEKILTNLLWNGNDNVQGGHKMFCPKCGKKLDDRSTYCDNCESKIQNEKTERNIPHMKQNTFSKGDLILKIAIACAALVGLGIVIICLFGNKNAGDFSGIL